MNAEKAKPATSNQQGNWATKTMRAGKCVDNSSTINHYMQIGGFSKGPRGNLLVLLAKTR
jgi:hypothetical protein